MKRKPELLPVRIYGDSILRQKAAPVDLEEPGLPDFLQDLMHTMYERDGVGLAAPQVGVGKRIFVIDPGWSGEEKHRQPRVIINPVVESSSGETVYEEGCISIPGIYARVIRPSTIRVSFTDPQGNRISEELTGYSAIVFQHEYDHLEGVLFTDRISALAKLKLKRRLKELEQTTVDGVNIRADIFRPDPHEL